MTDVLPRVTLGGIDRRYGQLLTEKGFEARPSVTSLKVGDGTVLRKRRGPKDDGDEGGRGAEITEPKLGGYYDTKDRFIPKPEIPLPDESPGKFRKKREGRKSITGEMTGGPGGVKRRKGSLWATSDVHRSLNHEAYVVYALRDFCLYIVFLLSTTFITFGVLDHAYNYYANVLSEVITNSKFPVTIGVEKTFKEVRSVPQIWEFINGVLLKVIYENNYDEARMLSLVKPESVLVLFENILVGVPRIRQIRVRNDSCMVAPMFADFFLTCYGYYSKDMEFKSSFGPQGPGIAWNYNEPEWDSNDFNGKISRYGAGGYTMNITREEAYTRGWVKQLMQNTWIGTGTRAVFIDFTTYTPNTNLFCVVKLIFELPPTGGVIPSSHFYTMKFLRYVNIWDHVILAFEVVFVGFLIYYTMEEIQEIVALKGDYLNNWWNILDLVILLLGYATVVAAVIRFTFIYTHMEEKVQNIETDMHSNFDQFVHLQLIFNTLIAVVSFLVWLKLLKYAALNKSVALILTIFKKVRLELLALTFMMFTMILGFSLLGNILFGTHVEQFNTISNSMFTLIGLFVGGMFFYSNCREAAPYFAPIYFILYIFIVIILFLNAYVALLVHGFYKAVEEFEDQRDRVYFMDVCRRLRYKFFICIKKNEYAERLREIERNEKNRKDYEALLNILRRHGYRALSLALILKKHDLAPGDAVSIDKMDEVFRDINARNQLFLEVEEHDKIMEQMDKISKKIEFLDQSLADIMSKVDILVDKLLTKKR